ncbi:O-antigen ligase family protein [Candidatus Woesebacteria bacterium]|nr:O-antigen ligase family protein [Candidatus Woesebacteria bacterium]
MTKILSTLNRLPLLVFHLLFLGLPLAVSFQSDELFEFPKMLVVYLAASIIAFCLGIEWIRRQRISIPSSPFNLPIGAFVVSQLLSTLVTLNSRTSWLGYYSRFNGGFFSTLSYVLLYLGWTQFVEKKELPRLLRSLLLGGVLAALYAFPEHFGVSPSCVLLSGDFTVSCWVQDVQARVFGTFGQPNWLAAYLIVVIPVAVATFLTSLISARASAKTTLKSYLPPAFWFAVTALFTSVLFFTQSRSGILGAVVGFSILGLGIVLVRRHINKPATVFVPFGLTVVLFVALMAIIGTPFNSKISQFTQRFLKSSTVTVAPTPTPVAGPALEVGGSESGDIRKVVWQGAIDVFKRHPLLGSGVETFAYSYYRDRPLAHNLLSEWDFLYNKAHNEFLNYLATTGIVGFATYTVMIGSFIFVPFYWAVKRTTQNSRTMESTLLLLSVSAGMAALSVSNFFGFSTVMVSLLTFLFPAIAWQLSTNQATISAKKTEKTYSSKEFTLTQWAQIAVACLLVILLGNSIRKLFVADTFHSQAKAASGSSLQTAFYASQQAVDILPNEPVYRDELAYISARMAYALSVGKDSTNAATLTQYSISMSDAVIDQNPAHLNFYKTRARIFLLLAQLNPTFYDEAIKTLTAARQLAPTDSKLVYSLAVIARAQGKSSEEETHLLEALRLRPVDENARIQLAELYQAQEKNQEAKEQYEYVIEFINASSQVAKDGIASLSATPTKK